MSMLPIITVPHPTLRLVAAEITLPSQEIFEFGQNLKETLDKKRDPAGVGLAAPQVDKLWRIFATKVGPEGRNSPKKTPLQLFVNPRIVAHSPNLTLGPNKKDPMLEGCLSMPGLYGPVPRWSWVEIEFEDFSKKGELKLESQKLRFEDFAARVIQHEADHLDGILFTDYANDYDLPVFQENKKGDLIEIEDKSLLAYL